jgi:hypothetical protein
MVGSGKTPGVRDADIYRHYAVGLYRQALLSRLQDLRASAVPGSRTGDMAAVVRVLLRRRPSA